MTFFMHYEMLRIVYNRSNIQIIGVQWIEGKIGENAEVPHGAAV